MSESSTSGWDLQVGTETKVTAGVKIKKFIELKAEKKIPPAFTRVWSDSHGMKKLEDFFSQKKGMATLTQGVCTMYEVDLNSFHLPPFRASFKTSLLELYKGASLSHTHKVALFRKFINEYGTHFQAKTQLGAIFMHQTLYSEVARKQFSAETLQSCNDRTGTRIFGIQVEKDKSQCTSSDQQKLNQLGSAHVQEYIITKGSRPTDIKDWAKQSFIPVPLRFQLSPIINLFTYEHLSAANIILDGKRIYNSWTIRQWFVPLYFEYCETFGIQSSCLPKKGCGYDDLCPVDTVCTPGGTTHECSQWTQWTCFESCRSNLQLRQRRQRTCSGCSGKTYVERFVSAGSCPPVPPCYKSFTTSVHHTNFDLDGHGNSVYLDRHNLVCPAGKALSGFKLQRNDLHNKIRYEYYCSTIQYPCAANYYKNTLKKDNGHGNLVYLDRLDVKCNGNDLMTSQRYLRAGRESWYHYGCCRIQYTHQQRCHYHYTPKSPHNGPGHVIYLDRQYFNKCPNNHAISSFHLIRADHTHIRYKLKCCKVEPFSG